MTLEEEIERGLRTRLRMRARELAPEIAWAMGASTEGVEMMLGVRCVICRAELPDDDDGIDAHACPPEKLRPNFVGLMPDDGDDWQEGE